MLFCFCCLYQRNKFKAIDLIAFYIFYYILLLLYIITHLGLKKIERQVACIPNVVVMETIVARQRQDTTPAWTQGVEYLNSRVLPYLKQVY